MTVWSVYSPTYGGYLVRQELWADLQYEDTWTNTLEDVFITGNYEYAQKLAYKEERVADQVELYLVLGYQPNTEPLNQE